MRELIKILQAKVNCHGELHLSKEHTDLVMEWMSSIEGTLADTTACIENVRTIFKMELDELNETKKGDDL